MPAELCPPQWMVSGWRRLLLPLLCRARRLGAPPSFPFCGDISPPADGGVSFLCRGGYQPPVPFPSLLCLRFCGVRRSSLICSVGFCRGGDCPSRLLRSSLFCMARPSGRAALSLFAGSFRRLRAASFFLGAQKETKKALGGGRDRISAAVPPHSPRRRPLGPPLRGSPLCALGKFPARGDLCAWLRSFRAHGALGGWKNSHVAVPLPRLRVQSQRPGVFPASPSMP